MDMPPRNDTCTIGVALILQVPFAHPLMLVEFWTRHRQLAPFMLLSSLIRNRAWSHRQWGSWKDCCCLWCGFISTSCAIRYYPIDFYILQNHKNIQELYLLQLLAKEPLLRASYSTSR